MTSARPAQEDAHQPGRASSGGGGGMGAAGAGSSSSTAHQLSVNLQHVGVHWVQGDGKLEGALTRVPLRIQLWRAQERSHALSPAAGAGASAPWASTTSLGSVDVDLSHLAAPAAAGAGGSKDAEGSKPAGGAR